MDTQTAWRSSDCRKSLSAHRALLQVRAAVGFVSIICRAISSPAAGKAGRVGFVLHAFARLDAWHIEAHTGTFAPLRWLFAHVCVRAKNRRKARAVMMLGGKKSWVRFFRFDVAAA